MMPFKDLFLTLLLVCFWTLGWAQLRPVKIEEERDRNRIHLYAVNENDQDLDVAIQVSGTGFRQRGGNPRFFRVPAASKVLIHSLVVERDAEPRYSFELTVNEELSKRVVRRDAQRIKIDPPKTLLVYKRPSCEKCKDLLSRLDSSYYNYRVMDLETKPKVREYVEYKLRDQGVSLDSTDNPVLSIDGKVRADIEDYDSLLKALGEKEN